MSDSYRIREDMVYVRHNGYTHRLERRFIAERRVRIFGFLSFWWPVIGDAWRKTTDAAMQDIHHDLDMRKPYFTQYIKFDEVDT